MTKKSRLFFLTPPDPITDKPIFFSPNFTSFLNIDIFPTFLSILSTGRVSKTDKFFFFYLTGFSPADHSVSRSSLHLFLRLDLGPLSSSHTTCCFPYWLGHTHTLHRHTHTHTHKANSASAGTKA